MGNSSVYGNEWHIKIMKMQRSGLSLLVEFLSLYKKESTLFLQTNLCTKRMIVDYTNSYSSLCVGSSLEVLPSTAQGVPSVQIDPHTWSVSLWFRMESGVRLDTLIPFTVKWISTQKGDSSTSLSCVTMTADCSHSYHVACQTSSYFKRTRFFPDWCGSVGLA